jgi:hypothetical protein
VPRQHLGKNQCHGAPASAALAAVGAEGALASCALRVCLVGIVAQNTAVAVQRAALAAVGAALLLERKSSVCNAGSSRTNRTQERGMQGLMPERRGTRRAFSKRRSQRRDSVPVGRINGEGDGTDGTPTMLQP